MVDRPYRMTPSSYEFQAGSVYWPVVTFHDIDHKDLRRLFPRHFNNLSDKWTFVGLACQNERDAVFSAQRFIDRFWRIFGNSLYFRPRWLLALHVAYQGVVDGR